jgi:hypothetical protein
MRAVRRPFSELGELFWVRDAGWAFVRFWFDLRRFLGVAGLAGRRARGGTTPTGVRGRNGGMVEDDRAAMVRALADEDALRVFAQVVAATGTGLPERSEGSISFHYVTAHGVSRQTGLPVSAVLGAGRRLTEARLTIAGTDGTSWRTDFESLRRAADPEHG